MGSAIKKIVLGASLCLPLVGSAAPSSLVAWTTETEALIESADAQRGSQLVASCAGCHGQTGVAVSPTYPSIAGQRADYTYKQLRDYRDGSRKNGLMQAMVKSLSDQDMADIALFFAQQTAPTATTSDGATEQAEVLVRLGDGKRMVPSCASCHANPGKRHYHGSPLLEGQHVNYLEATLKAFRSQSRANDVYWVMRSVAGSLSDEEIAQLARYYAGAGS